jgi:AcrR family transcriptional regulator
MNNNQTHSKQQTILQAANRVVLADGATNLTLDAVAREAGVSKGGLLYHFPGKEALVVGMVQQFIADFELALQREMDQDDSPEEKGRWLRAYVRTTFAPADTTLAVSAALLTAFATNPDLLAQVHQSFAQWQQRSETDGLDPARATLIRLATDGLWFADLLGFAPPGEPLRSQLRDALLDLIKES